MRVLQVDDERQRAAVGDGEGDERAVLWGRVHRDHVREQDPAHELQVQALSSSSSTVMFPQIPLVSLRRCRTDGGDNRDPIREFVNRRDFLSEMRSHDPPQGSFHDIALSFISRAYPPVVIQIFPLPLIYVVNLVSGLGGTKMIR